MRRYLPPTVPAALLVVLAGCDSPSASELDPSIRALLGGALAVGAVETFAGSFAEHVALDGGGSGAEYIFVVSNASTQGTGSIAVNVQGEGVTSGPALVVEPRPELGPAGDRLAALHPEGEEAAHRFHVGLRRRERALARSTLGGLPGGGRSLLIEAAGEPAAVPEVDDVVEFNVNASVACESPIMREGRVEAVSAQAIVVADLANPAGLTRADYQQIAAEFDAKVFPLSSNNFGEPARAIGPPRTTIFFTSAVNELASGFGGLIGGFFFARDLFPRVGGGGLGACPSSNEREMFYVLAADPQGQHGQTIPVEHVVSRSLATVMHEHQHLVNASRRLYVTGAGSFEEVWLNEALSHVAEELLFYQESGLSPRMNLGLDDVRANQTRLDAVNRFQVQNLVRYSLYLEDTPGHTPIDPTDGLEMRGASWSFLRYLADHHADDDRAFFFALVNAVDVGIDNLRGRLGAAVTPALVRWTVSNYADDLVSNLSASHRQPSWNFRSLLPALDEDEAFPFVAERLGPGGSVSASVRSGSALYLVVGVPAGATATVTTRVGGGPPPETARVSAVRSR